MKNILLFLIILNTTFGYKNYYNYTLFRSVPGNEEHVEFMRNLGTIIKIDYWQHPGLTNKPVDVLISPEDKPKFLKMMDDRKYDYTTIIEDAQSAFDKQTIKVYIRRKMKTFDWHHYFSLRDIYDWMNDLSKLHPDEVKILNLGKTSQGRDLLGAKVSLKGSKRRSIVIVEGGIHAREWISIAFVTYFLNQLLGSGYSPETTLGRIAKTYEFIFIPVLNPDGYEYSLYQDRMWRKNRNGHGVDLNRNFDIAFGTGYGISFDERYQTYCGPSAFSELESRAIRNLLASLRNKIEYYIAFHSYGQFIIIPYAFLNTHEENYDEVFSILKQARINISRRFGTKYTIGTSFDTVGYKTSGVSGCWVKKEHRVPYVVTFELRDEGNFGFALPPHLIIPTCEETLDGVITILQPKSKFFLKLNDFNVTEPQLSGDDKKRNVLQVIVIIFNALFFIIVR